MTNSVITLPTTSVAKAPIPDTTTSVQPTPFQASVMCVMCRSTMIAISVFMAVTMSVRKKSIQPVPAGRDHTRKCEGVRRRRQGRGVEIEHGPGNPQADHQLDDRPHREGAGHGDLDTRPDDDHRGQPAPQRGARVEDRRPVGGDDVVQHGIEKPLKVVAIFGGNIGRDGRIDLLLGGGGDGAQHEGREEEPDADRHGGHRASARG